MRPTKSRSRFGRLAKATARVTGRPATFILAVSVILAWLLTGPLFRFSDTWQLVINTGTTIITFLMVFLIQATPNRDAEAVQVKLDELLGATAGRTTPCWISNSLKSGSSTRYLLATGVWPRLHGQTGGGESGIRACPGKHRCMSC
jgi:hypothetical protein